MFRYPIHLIVGLILLGISSGCSGVEPKSVTTQPGLSPQPIHTTSLPPDGTPLPVSATPIFASVTPVLRTVGPILNPTTLQPLSGSGGGRIVFTSKRHDNYEIYIMKADGSDQRRLTRNIYEDNHPVWSPDCSRIAFSSDRGGHFDIYVMDADGLNVQRLTTKGDNEEPSWSPDGTRLVFQYNMNSNCEIYTMNLDGSGLQRLTTEEANDVEPDWD